MIFDKLTFNLCLDRLIFRVDLLSSQLGQQLRAHGKWSTLESEAHEKAQRQSKPNLEKIM